MHEDVCCAGDVSFSFTLANPQLSQQAQLVSVTAGPIGTSSGQWVGGTSSTPALFDVDNDLRIAPVSEVRDYPKSPLRVKNVVFSAASRISHQGGGLCTEAKITVSFTPNAPLPISCLKFIKISHLYGILTPSTENVVVVSKCGSSLASVASWNKTQSELVILVLQEIEKDKNCEFDVFLTKKDSAKAFEGATISAPPLVQEQFLLGNITGEMAANNPDLQITVCQSSPYPCMDNTVTVTMISSTPLYRRCQPKLTIAGLKLSPTLSQNLATTYAIQDGPERSGLTSIWNQNTGSLTFDMNAILDLEGRSNLTKVVFQVVLKNPRLSQDAPTLSVSASLFYVEGVSWTEDYSTCSPNSVKPFFIESLGWSTVAITSSTTHPCTSNTILVSLVPTIPLACAKCFTLIGFTGSLTANQPTFPLTSGGSGNPFSSAAWTKDDGNLKVCVDSGKFLPINQAIVFSFQIQNVNAQKNALTSIEIDVSVDDTTGSLLSELSITNTGGGFMEVVAPSWSTNPSPSISFSSTQPCGTNRVVVALKPVYAVRTSCCSSLTLSGLTGARSRTASAFALTSSQGFQANANWDLSSSRLIVTLASDLNSEGSYGFTFDVLNQAAEVNPSAFPSLSGCGLPSYSLNSAVQVSSLTISAIAQQQWPYPCSLNTISVTITPSVSLLNTCADSTGAQSFQYPKLTISGFTGSKDGTIAVSTNSPAPYDQNSITVEYSTTTKNIVINFASSSAGLLANTANTFIFQYRNRENAQNALALKIQADPGVLTNPAPFTIGDGAPSWIGYYPGYIMDPTVVASTNVYQSSDMPCAKNTISVSITTNVSPLVLTIYCLSRRFSSLSCCCCKGAYKLFGHGNGHPPPPVPRPVHCRLCLSIPLPPAATPPNDPPCCCSLQVPIFAPCNPRLTLTGLFASSTPDVGTSSDLSPLEGTLSQAGSLSIFSWIRTSGTLVLTVSTIDTLDTAFPLGQTKFNFDFKLVNPSFYQDAPGVNLIFRYASLSNSVWKNEATNNGASFVRHGSSTSVDRTSTSYPMKIKRALVLSSIQQSSPYPCDQNTITVTIQTDIHLYPRCVPSISLTGLEQTQTADGALTVSVAQVGDRTGTWVKTGGKLDFNIFTPAQAETDANTAGENAAIRVGAQVAGYTIVEFSFTLTNPKAQQASPLTGLSLKLIDKPPVGKSGYTTAFHVQATHTSSEMTFSGTSGLIFDGKDSCSTSPQTNDARPLHIRLVAFTTLNVIQANANPCAGNTITLTFQANG